MNAIALPLMIAGSGLSAYSTIMGGAEAAEVGKIQQQQYEAEAKGVELASLEEQRQKRKEGREITASQIAAFSASGGLVGSNLVIMAETARNIEADALTIERNAKIKAGALRKQGQWARYEGQMTRRNARMRAFANMAGTAGQMYFLYKYPQQKKTSVAGTTWNRVKSEMSRPDYYSRI